MTKVLSPYIQGLGTIAALDDMVLVTMAPIPSE
jgi:hypothetical protein